MKKRLWVIVLAFCCLWLNPIKAWAQETEEEKYQEYLEILFGNYDLSGMDEAIVGYFPEVTYNSTEFIHLLMQGEIKEVIQNLWSQLCSRLWGELPFARQVFIYILVIGIISSFFSGFSDLFAGGKQEKIAFYLLYLTLLGVLIKVFSLTSGIASEVIGDVIDFVKMFIPTYCFAVAVATGTKTAVAYYEVLLLVIYFIEKFIMGVILPMAYSYIMLSFLNGIWAEERLVLLLNLLKKGVELSLKIALGIITGFSLVQAVIVPVVDGLRNSAIHKMISALPGIGGAAKGITEMLMGSAVLIKNSMGILLLLLLLGLCIVPALKIGFVALSVKIASAITGIVSDKRISECADHVGEGCFLLLRCVFTSVALFFIVIAVIAYSVMI